MADESVILCGLFPFPKLQSVYLIQGKVVEKVKITRILCIPY